jgi:hypothetical protein
MVRFKEFEKMAGIIQRPYKKIAGGNLRVLGKNKERVFGTFPQQIKD